MAECDFTVYRIHPGVTHLLVLICTLHKGAQFYLCVTGCSSATPGAVFLVGLTGLTEGKTGSPLSGTWCHCLCLQEVKV